MTRSDFNDLARRLAKHLGISREAAEDLAAHLGDVWETDDHHHVLIRDAQGTLLARVPESVVDDA